MTDAERATFSECLFVLAETFKESLSPLRVEAYWMALRDLTLDQFKIGAALAMQGSKFFPKPVELRECVFGNPVDRSELGWIAWRDAARRIGGGASIVLEDAPLAETLLAVFGSWPAACAIELSDEMWSSKRKEFARVYRVMLLRGAIGIRYLTGSYELHNTARREWQRHTPVGRIAMNGEVSQLSGDQAAAYRLPATPNELPPAKEEPSDV